MNFEIDIHNQYNLLEDKKYSTCPLCSENRKKKTDKCLILDWERGLGTCQHCGEIIQLHTYKRKTDIVYEKPPVSKKLELSENIIKFFEKRCISKNTLVKMKISEGVEYMPQIEKKINTIHFNFFINNELVNVKYRDNKKNFKLFKGAEKVFYNLDGILNRKECIIVEGEMDCLSFIEIGQNNVVSVPNGANINLDYLDNCYEYFEDKEKIYICVDNDEKGIILKNELIRRLGAEKCLLVDLSDCKDANEYLCKYTPEKLLGALKTAKECPLDNILTFQSVKNDLYDFYENGMQQGFKTGLTKFDDIFSTYLGQFITITGIPTMGKSEFVDQMCVGYNLTNKWKIAFASPENKPTFLHLDKIIRKIFGSKPTKNILTSETFEKVEKHITDNFYFIDYEDGFDLISVLSKGAELVKRKGIKVLVIDPFNKIRLKGSVNKVGSPEYVSEYLYEIEKFCRKYNVLVLLIAHPRKPSGENAKMYEPTFYDIKGGGEFYDMSPHGLLVHRDYELNNVKIKVLKVKFSNLGENNAEVYFKWNKNNGRYSNIDAYGQEIKDDTNWLGGEQKELYLPNKFTESEYEYNKFPEIIEEIPF